MQLSQNPETPEKSEEYKALEKRILELSGNFLMIKRLDEWRAKLFQLCLKRLSSELEGEEDHGTSYSMMRLNNFFSTQLAITQIGSALPHNEESTYGIAGLEEMIAIQEAIMKIDNHEDKFQLDDLLVSLLENKTICEALQSYNTVAKKLLEPRKVSGETQSWPQKFKERILGLVK